MDLIRPYISGRDITKLKRALYTVDSDKLTLQQLESNYPVAYQYLLLNVKPDRDQNPRKQKRDYWWVHGENQPSMRKSIKGLDRFIATAETAKHRFFVFEQYPVLPEGKVIVVASDDAFILGVCNSKIHSTYSDAAGGRLGVGNDSVYNKSKCFDPFPFPAPTEAQRQTIRDLAERLDAHRKRQQALHPKLTMTGMYNVLERERSGEVLSDKERKIHQRGLVSILRQLHDELDAAVAAAYGWPADLDEQEILQRLVDLNAERAAEEARGLVRWLRPEYQAPDELVGKQSALELVDEDAPAPVVLAEKRKWPKDKPGQVTVLREVLAAAGGPVGEAALAEAFAPKLSKKRLGVAVGLLEVLGGLGLVGWSGGGWVLE